jgi:MerR family mercuric resistance operon transcriptional regulator
MKPLSDPASDTYTISALAKAVNVNVETIRYYQRTGLIDKPLKPQQGYRLYPAATAHRIRFIKRAQELGFTLQEITELLSLNDGDCEEARILAEHKQDVIQKRIKDLNAIWQELEKLVQACRNNAEGQDRCAIIETLTK